MSSTTDADLRVLSDAALAEAQGIMGLPAVVVGADVSGDDFWDRTAARAQSLLDKARKLPMAIASRAARKVRDAASWGVDKASTASDAVKRALKAIGAAAGVLALGPGILLGVAMFLLIESTGYGKRARSAGRRYVDRRARSYGL